jgi:hypothetical protein
MPCLLPENWWYLQLIHNRGSLCAGGVNSRYRVYQINNGQLKSDSNVSVSGSVNWNLKHNESEQEVGQYATIRSSAKSARTLDFPGPATLVRLW